MLICPVCFHILDAGDMVCPTCGSRRPAIGWDREEYLGVLLLDRYEVVQRLGAGATGAVYLAHDRRAEGDAKKVAVKFLHRRLGQDETLALRFRREALASSQIRSPYVASTVGYGELPDGARFLVMEFIEGRGLEEYIRQHPRVDVQKAVDLALQIAEALQAAHEVGIVHRDLKPANIYLVRQPDGGYAVKVLDFGYAFIKAREQGGLKLTQTGLILGTPTYMSPEQTQGKRDIDGRSDLYALGVLLYRMIAGRPPLQADTVMDLVLKHRRERPPLLSEVAEDVEVPAGLEKAIMKLLAKRREERFPTARAVKDALAPFASSAGRVAAGEPEDVEETGGDRRWLLIGVAAAAVAAVVVLLAVFGVF